MPIYVKIGATRVENDVKLAVKAGADVVVIDGMQGGTAATQQDVFIEHAGIPTLAAVVQAVEALEEMDVIGEVQLDHLRRHPHRGRRGQGPRPGGRRGLHRPGGADGPGLQRFRLVQGRQDARQRRRGLREARHGAGLCHHCHTGRCPVGITTQDPELEKRLTPTGAPRGLRNYLQVLNMELTTLARACGKSNVHHLEREDLVALTIEAAAMAKVPLAGTKWIPGVSGF